LVIAGVGAGALGDLTDECVEIAASGRAVIVRSSRVGAGRVVRDSGYHEPRMVASDNLSPQKAAVLLSLALTRTNESDEIQRMFDEY
jgi:L-asparaginase/Glu-tRNA(Gln) amidotransferase subunit D